MKEAKSINDYPVVLTVSEVSDILRINKTRTYQLTHQKDFPSTRIGKRIIIPRDAFFKWLDRQTKELVS